jgi:hypothetical protein
VTASGGDSIDQVGLVRSSDGVLHVAWHKDGDLLHTAISRRGKIGATSPIQSGWTGHMDAALTTVPGGIRVVWGAIRCAARRCAPAGTPAGRTAAAASRSR